MRGALLVSLFLAGLLAGCSQPEDPAAVAAVVEPPTPEDEAVDWSATMPSSFCANAGGGSFCGSGISIGSGTGEPNPTYIHDSEERHLVGGLLTLEWEVATPTTENLRVVVFALSGCPDECEANRSLASQTGPSPLTVQVPAMAGGEGLSVAVRVEPVDFAQGNQMSLGQDVHLSGSLTFVDPATSVAATTSHADHEDEANATR